MITLKLTPEETAYLEMLIASRREALADLPDDWTGEDEAAELVMISRLEPKLGGNDASLTEPPIRVAFLAGLSGYVKEVLARLAARSDLPEAPLAASARVVEDERNDVLAHVEAVRALFPAMVEFCDHSLQLLDVGGKTLTPTQRKRETETLRSLRNSFAKVG